MVDIRTGMLVWCSQGFTLAAFLYLLWRQHPRARFYLMWSLGFVLSTLGFALTLGRDHLPPLVAIALAHAIALSGYTLWIIGFCLLEKRKPNWTALLPPAIWLSGIFLPWVFEDMLNRVALFHLANATGASLLIGALSGSAGRGEPAAKQLSTMFAAISMFSFAVALAIAVRHFSADEATVVAAVGAFGNGILQLLAIALSIRLVMLRSERRWHDLSVTDPLTGTLNRRGLQDAFTRVKDDSGSEKLAALLFDLDRFKLLNDRFGHQAGDDALVAFARTARRFIPSAAAFGRVGGEEFAAFLAVVDHAQAEALAETIRAETCRLPIQTRSALVPISVSVGVAVMTIDDADWDRLYSSADRALYQAKRAGRNRTVVFDENSTAALASDETPVTNRPVPDVDRQVDALRRISALSRR